jgi:hypothetical protein
VVRNYQVVHLSPASFDTRGILSANAQAADLAIAKDLLTEWTFVGLVEDFEESCKRYQSIIGRIIPEFTLPVFWKNRTTGSVLEADLQLEAIRNEIGLETYDQAMAENALDLELYSFAMSLRDSA